MSFLASVASWMVIEWSLIISILAVTWAGQVEVCVGGGGGAGLPTLTLTLS